MSLIMTGDIQLRMKQLLLLGMDRKHALIPGIRKDLEYPSLRLYPDDSHVPGAVAGKHLQAHDKGEKL